MQGGRDKEMKVITFYIKGLSVLPVPLAPYEGKAT